MPAALFVAIGGWIGATTTVGAFLIADAAWISMGAMLLGSMALSDIQQRKAARQARDQFNAAQVDRLVTTDSSTTPRDLVLGRVRKAGQVFFKASTGVNQEKFVLLQTIAAHEVDAVETVYLNDLPVTLDSNGYVQTAPYALQRTVSASYAGWGAAPSNAIPGTVVQTYSTYVPGVGNIGNLNQQGDTGVGTTSPITTYQYYVTDSKARIRWLTGAPGQVADARMMSLFPGVWTSACTATGVAYLIAEFDYDETAFPSGLPSISVVVRGAKLYDPRTGVTAWSENPALMARFVALHPQFGKRTSLTSTEDARIVAAANACDVGHDYGDGYGVVPLFRAGSVWPFGGQASTAFDDICQAMAGTWAYSGGEIYIKAGVYSAPVMSLSDSDLAVVVRDDTGSTSQQPITISPHRARAQKVNVVNVTIWDSGQDSKQVPLTPLKGAALITRDGAELVQAVTMAAVPYASQALHVAGVLMRDARDPLTVSVTFKLTAYPVEMFDTISLTIPRMGWSAKTFMVLGHTWSLDGLIQLQLKETTATIFQPDAAFAPQGYAANTGLPSPWDVAPPSLQTINSGTGILQLNGDGTITTRVLVQWAPLTDNRVTSIEVQWQPAGADVWQSESVTPTETQAYLIGPSDGTTILVKARCRTTLAVSDWTAQQSHVVIGKTAAPPPFDTFTVMAQPDGTRQYNFGYSGAAPVDWLGAEIRYVSGTTTTPDWSSMTKLQDSKTYYTSSPVELNYPLSGDYTFACKSLDTTGNESSYLVRSLTLPDRRLGNVFDEYYEHLEGWLGTLTGCHIEDGILESNDTTTWATTPSTWDAWTRWSWTPTSPITYVTPVRDFGTIVLANVNSTVVADGSIVQEIATSNDGTTWSAWATTGSPFSCRYIKLRLTVTATTGSPVPAVHTWGYLVNAAIKSEYINDCVISSLTGAYRIGVGDVRIPLVGTYAVIKRTTIVIQDSSAGTWTYARIDQALTYGPRWQFRLNGVLADPAFVDFFVEGY